MCTVVTAVENATSDAGKKLYYQFNDSGNVVAMRDELGYGQFAKFEAGVDNKPSEISKLRKVVVNQLRKIDFSGQWTSSGLSLIHIWNTGSCMKRTRIRVKLTQSFSMLPLKGSPQGQALKMCIRDSQR